MASISETADPKNSSHRTNAISDQPQPEAISLREQPARTEAGVMSSGMKSVTILPDQPIPSSPVSLSRRRMERELHRMQQAEENARQHQSAMRKKKVAKALAAIREQKRKEGVTITPDVKVSRAAIRQIMMEEERMALEKDQAKLRQETETLQQEIDHKYRLKDKKQGHDLLSLAESFCLCKVNDVPDGLPDQLRRELTREEVKDLKLVFDMFDTKERGFITSSDVQRAASMLGFKAKKQVFREMIGEITGKKQGRVTFTHFLQFVVKSQDDGDDPLEDILQGFRMLDRGEKGYLTADDLRTAADSQKLSLSNRAIGEMMHEADFHGDSRITPDEFVHVMLQTSLFRGAR